MKFTSEIILPHNSVEMENEEMMYTEGGYVLLAQSNQWYGRYSKVKYTGTETNQLISWLNSPSQTIVPIALTVIMAFASIAISAAFGVLSILNSSASNYVLSKMNSNGSGVTLGIRENLPASLWDVWDNY